MPVLFCFFVRGEHAQKPKFGGLFEDLSKDSSETFQLLQTITNISDHIRKSFPKISEHLRRFPKISVDFRTISEYLRTIPKILKNHTNIWKTLLKLFPKFSKSFINRLSSSKMGLKRYRSFRKFVDISELFPVPSEFSEDLGHGLK